MAGASSEGVMGLARRWIALTCLVLSVNANAQDWYSGTPCHVEVSMGAGLGAQPCAKAARIS